MNLTEAHIRTLLSIAKELAEPHLDEDGYMFVSDGTIIKAKKVLNDIQRANESNTLSLTGEDEGVG